MQMIILSYPSEQQVGSVSPQGQKKERLVGFPACFFFECMYQSQLGLVVWIGDLEVFLGVNRLSQVNWGRIDKHHV